MAPRTGHIGQHHGQPRTPTAHWSAPLSAPRGRRPFAGTTAGSSPLSTTPRPGGQLRRHHSDRGYSHSAPLRPWSDAQQSTEFQSERCQLQPGRLSGVSSSRVGAAVLPAQVLSSPGDNSKIMNVMNSKQRDWGTIGDVTTSRPPLHVCPCEVSVVFLLKKRDGFGRVMLIMFKGTNPALKKPSNIPEIYAKMFGRFH